ncbi:hypothetical protein [Erythrobacter rubeus]|uniref:Uncharacterized protein n=1 Tax=Erythrobacter rubeus TaxID=2760803 RepID=A0ABR8KM26_9SPHN|nr:hypothetical protein [Erythrobacter rubeus]MBD2841554.1 hypothetical protein [Erythrobacter rubeus]
MIKRRLLAAAILFVFAVGSALYWNDGTPDWVLLSVNLAAALIGLTVLHFRWRSRERRSLSPEKAKDIFS